MALSDDLGDAELYVDLARLGQLNAPLDLDKLRLALAHFAERAAELERTLAETAEQLSPRRDGAARAARDAAIASGKVVSLAAVRLARSPELAQPGWIA